MERDRIFRFITGIFSTMTEVETIREEHNLIEDLGISSMDILTLMSYLEEEFHIIITERMIRKVATVEDLVDLVENAVN